MLGQSAFRARKKNSTDPVRVCEQCGAATRYSEQTTYTGRPAFLKRRYCGKACEAAAKSVSWADLFERHVIRQDGCWAWSGRFQTNGYTLVQKNTGQIAGHRLSYLLHKGEIPVGHFVMHDCDNPICTNPDHLRIGTPKENTADMIQKGRAFWQKGDGQC